MSSKKCPRKVTQKEDISWTFLSTKCRQKCPRDVNPFVHEMSPIMSTKCLPPKLVRTNLDPLQHILEYSSLKYKLKIRNSFCFELFEKEAGAKRNVKNHPTELY